MATMQDRARLGIQWRIVEERMTPEDKIVDAIDRNTNALTTIVWWLAAITGCLLAWAISAKATPLLPPLDQPPIFDIGDPPKPPPNPNIQYWYTMDVPGPDGVLPSQVFVPKLYSHVATMGPVDVPEPGAWILVIAMLIVIAIRAAWKDANKL